MKFTFILSFLLLLLTGITHAQLRYFYADVNSVQEVPTNSSTATGVVILTYNTVNKVLQVTGDYQNLTDTVTVSHIHGPAAVGINAGVLINLINTKGKSGTLSATATLTATLEGYLYAGTMYVNVHSKTFAGGEIRGQVLAASTTNAVLYNGRLQGASQVPPNGSAGSGSFNLLLDKTSNMVYVTGSFMGLSGNATVSHIHRAIVNTNGPVIITLSPTLETSGTIHGISAINPADVILLEDFGLYVNLHSAVFGGGELRGQINNLYQGNLFSAVLNAAQEVPTNPSTARGTVIVNYNMQTKRLQLFGDFQNLSGIATMAHVHGPAAIGVNAPPVFDITFSPLTSSIISADVTLTAQQEANLFAGLFYVNIHSTVYGGGEIRGQLKMQTPGETQFFTGLMQGAQEPIPSGSAGVGLVNVLLDKVTREVFVTGGFQGLQGNATVNHIHRGPTGVDGPVVVGLTATQAIGGTMTGNAIVSQSFADSMIRGFTYVNLHSTAFPGGELRAQLGNVVLPVRLTSFNGYKDRNAVVLVWETAQELELKQYEVEQQDIATRVWTKKATVPAKNLANATSYRINDQPLSGKANYVIYRLKMVDKNGSVSYSNTIRLNFARGGAVLNLLSNPVTNGTVRFTITGLANAAKADVSIIDITGRLMYGNTISAMANNSIDVSSFSRGTYKLLVRVNNTVLNETFVK